MCIHKSVYDKIISLYGPSVLYEHWCRMHSNSTTAAVLSKGVKFHSLIVHLYDNILRVVLIRIVLPGQQVSMCMYEYTERTRLLFENQHISKVWVFCVWRKRNNAKKCCLNPFLRCFFYYTPKRVLTELNLIHITL